MTDNPFIYPENFNYEIDSQLGLKLSRRIVLSYFESIFENDGSLINLLGNIKQIKIEEYE